MVICLAGCAGGHGSILWQRNRTRFVETVDGAGGLNLLRGSIGRAREPADAATEVVHQAEAVICLAGCNGPVGLVVWRGMRLAWIRDESKADLMAALRKLGDRLAAQDCGCHADAILRCRAARMGRSTSEGRLARRVWRTRAETGSSGGHAGRATELIRRHVPT